MYGIGTWSMDYYQDCLPECIERAIRNVCVYRKLANILESNSSWETILKEKIINSLQGIGTYDELSKDDIDHLIDAFKEIQEKLDV